MRAIINDNVLGGLPVAVRSGKYSPTPELNAADLPRSRGVIQVAFKRRREKTVLDTLYQSGCLRLRIPRSEPRSSPEAVIMNTAGGLTGGDEVTLNAFWGSDTGAVVCGQAAEKIYRSRYHPVRISNRLDVQRRARAEWLPQETIVFNGAVLDRRLEVHVETGAEFLGLEAVVLGRTAMGEVVVSGSLRDSWRVYRDRRLVYADLLHLDGNIADRLDRKAIGAGARAFATVLLVAETITQELLELLRSVLAKARGIARASLWNGILAARFLARDGETLRNDLCEALSVLRDGRALPRVWQC